MTLLIIAAYFVVGIIFGGVYSKHVSKREAHRNQFISEPFTALMLGLLVWPLIILWVVYFTVFATTWEVFSRIGSRYNAWIKKPAK